MNREQEMYFDQCMDFLARMIEKYGDRVKFPDEPEHEYPNTITPADGEANQIAA